MNEGNLSLEIKIYYPIYKVLPSVLLFCLTYRNPCMVPEPAAVLALAAFKKSCCYPSPGGTY